LELAELLHSRKHGHAVAPLLVVWEEVDELTLLIIINLLELMTLKLNAVEAHACPGFQEGLEENLKLSPLLVLLEVLFDLFLSCVLSLMHVVELADQVIREFDDRIEMPQLYQGLILVDANLHYREGLLVSFHILERGFHILEGLRSY
jgi:hypothetical protein